MDMKGWRQITRKLTEDEATPAPCPPQSQAELEAAYGEVWCSFTLARDFEVEAFSAARVVAVRRCDKVRGTLAYQPAPRFYWGFEPS